MTQSTLTKNSFIQRLSEAFLEQHSAWRTIYRDKKSYFFVAGRQAGNNCLVFVDFSCRPDRYWFGHGVGWCPSLEYFLAWQARSENAPLYLRDGSLIRLQKLDKPRDFQQDEMRVTTGSLYKPFPEYRLEGSSPYDLQQLIETEINQYALPYLCMMLKARHSILTTPRDLATAQDL
jgi:hypothetical protein